MPYSDYRPDLMGSAALSPSGSFEAGSMQSFTLVYTAGAFGVDDTGSIKIGFRFATDFGPVQFTDPKGQGYTTVEASNGATLEAKWEFKRNIRPWSRSLYIGVVKDFLAPGDTITIRFGDRRQGSPGIRLQTYCESAFEFRVLADPIATYDYVAIPESPQIAIVPGPGVRWRAVLPTMVRAGEPFRLSVKADDKWGNTSDKMDRTLRLAVEGAAVTGLPQTLRFAPAASPQSPTACAQQMRETLRSACSMSKTKSCAARIRCARRPGICRWCTSGATRTGSRTRHSAPTMRVPISSSGATRPSSM